jgi:sulfate transport system permease protein
LRPAIAAGSLLAFSRSLGEFGAIVFVAGNIPNKTLTAPVFITQLINVSPDQAAAVSALIFGLAFMVVLVTEKLISRHSDRYSA